jgi:hypothetical protein
MNDDQDRKLKPSEYKPEKEQTIENYTLTEEKFLKTLNQAILYKPKPSRGQGKKTTSE